MKIEHCLTGGELTVKLIGELDEKISSYVRLSLDSLIDGPQVRRVVFDLSELTFMDSTGIGVLIGRYKRLKPRAIPIFIRSPRPNVDKVLTLSGIYSIMFKAG